MGIVGWIGGGACLVGDAMGDLSGGGVCDNGCHDDWGLTAASFVIVCDRRCDGDGDGDGDGGWR